LITGANTRSVRFYRSVGIPRFDRFHAISV